MELKIKSYKQKVTFLPFVFWYLLAESYLSFGIIVKYIRFQTNIST